MRFVSAMAAAAARAGRVATVLVRLGHLDDVALDRLAALGELVQQVDDLDGVVEHLTHHSGEIEVRVGNVEAVCGELYLQPTPTEGAHGP